MDTGSPPRRFYVISHPRTASNLLLRILALDSQPEVQKHENNFGSGYFFVRSTRMEDELGLLGKNVDTWTKAEKDQVKEVYQLGFERMEKYIASAEANGKIAVIKGIQFLVLMLRGMIFITTRLFGPNLPRSLCLTNENIFIEHGTVLTEPTSRSNFLFGQANVQETPWMVQVPKRYGLNPSRSLLNHTILPDEVLATILPTFLIRHPALVFPSHYRSLRDVGMKFVTENFSRLNVLCTFHWIRSQYDWWNNHLCKVGRGKNGTNNWVSFLVV